MYLLTYVLAEVEVDFVPEVTVGVGVPLMGRGRDLVSGRRNLKWCCWPVIVLAQVVLIWPETDLYC